MLNYVVAPELLRPFVPAGTVPDQWRGRTWLSLVGFRFLHTRILGAPIPFHRHFPEINLRFYVRGVRDPRRAVVFLREIVPRRAIAATARLLYNEPYIARPMRARAPMAPQDSPPPIEYAWRHAGRWHRLGATPSGPSEPIRAGSDEEFIAEHYVGYTRQRDGGTIAYEVRHPRWRMWPVTDIACDVDFTGEFGSVGAAITGPPDSAFLADGSTVTVGWPRRLAPAFAGVTG